MTVEDYEKKLRSVYKLWPMRAYYRMRKLVRHSSVRNYKTYNDYQAAQISRLRRKSSASTEKEISPKSSYPGTELHRLFASGDYLAFLDIIEDRAAGKAAADLRDPVMAVDVVRAALEVGDPDRALNLQEILLSGHAAHNKRFRTDFFICLLTASRLSEARDFARETLLLGAFDAGGLLRMAGDHRLLGDDPLCIAMLEAALHGRGGPLKGSQVVYAQDLLSTLAGPDTALKWVTTAVGAKSREDAQLFLFNTYARAGQHERALRNLNGVLAAHELTAVNLINPDVPLSVTNIDGGASDGREENGPLVTIAMSTFNSATTVLASLRSLSAQRYRALEILVVDDCSSDNTRKLVADYAANVDNRVRLIALDENGGTYRARNVALKEARGHLFTCNDSDDWAHPQKIGVLVDHLLGNPQCIAVQSRLLRLNSKTGLKPKRNGYVHDDASSLLYYRDPVHGALGFYDTNKFGADSEFAARLMRQFADRSIGVVTKPLLIADWSENSLSGALATGISDGGTMAVSRVQYRYQYQTRHRGGHLERVEFGA